MLLLGCKPHGRHTEQHDIFFSIGHTLKELVPSIVNFWPEAAPKIHIDAWREVTMVNGHGIKVVPRTQAVEQVNAPRIFFINLGGYKENEFEEFHYKILAVANDKDAAIRQARQTAFYKHVNSPHVDDKYGVDVDDVYEITDILPAALKETYTLEITPQATGVQDELHMGYFKLDAL